MIEQKDIGFSLRGKIGQVLKSEPTIENLQEAEVELFPFVASQGFLINDSEDILKPIPVELPEEMKEGDYGKMYRLLLQSISKPCISREGFEKLGTNRLVIHFDNEPNAAPLDVHILIRGKVQKADYKIKINPKRLILSVGEIRFQQATDYHRAKLNLDDMQGIDENTLVKVLAKLNTSNFHIAIQGEQLVFSLGQPLKQMITKWRKAAPEHRFRKVIPDESAKVESHDPCKNDFFNSRPEFLNHDPEVYNRCEGNQAGFIDHLQLIGYEQTDIGRSIDEKGEREFFPLWASLLAILDEDSLIDPEMLQAMCRALDCMQVQNYLKEMKYAREKKVERDVFFNQTEVYKNIDVLGRLADFLNVSDERDENQPLLMYLQLHAVVGVLSIVGEISNTYRDAIFDVYDAIFSFARRKDIRTINSFVDYMTSFAEQCFSINDIGNCPLKDWSKDLFKIFIHMSDEKTIREPWQIVSQLFEKDDSKAYRHIKTDHDLVSFERMDRWFLSLIAVMRIVLDPSPDIFSNFLQGLENNFGKVKEGIDLQHPFFVFGLTEFLSKVSLFGEYEEEGKELQKKGEILLKTICLNNEKEDRTLPFNVPHQTGREELKEAIGLILNQSHGNRRRTRFFIHAGDEIKQS